jgi:hypothetical protein
LVDVASACATPDAVKDFVLTFDKVKEYNPEIVYMYLYEDGKRILIVFERATDHKGSYRAEVWSLQSKERIHRRFFEMPQTKSDFEAKNDEHSGDFKVVQMQDGP